MEDDFSWYARSRISEAKWATPDSVKRNEKEMIRERMQAKITHEERKEYGELYLQTTYTDPDKQINATVTYPLRDPDLPYLRPPEFSYPSERKAAKETVQFLEDRVLYGTAEDPPLLAHEDRSLMPTREPEDFSFWPRWTPVDEVPESAYQAREEIKNELKLQKKRATGATPEPRVDYAHLSTAQKVVLTEAALRAADKAAERRVRKESERAQRVVVDALEAHESAMRNPRVQPAIPPAELPEPFLHYGNPEELGQNALEQSNGRTYLVGEEPTSDDDDPPDVPMWDPSEEERRQTLEYATFSLPPDFPQIPYEFTAYPHHIEQPVAYYPFYTPDQV